MNKITKFSTQEVKAEEDRTLIFVGSDETVDRDDEVIKLSAWELTAFKSNPVILLNHNSYDLPIAKCTKVWKSQGKLKFKVQFPEASVSSLGDSVYKLYKNGYMQATSVGFKPEYKSIVWGDSSKGEPAVTYTNVELLELSLVSIGCNPNALLSSKGITDAIEAKCIDELEAKELVSQLKDFDEDALVTKTIKQVDEKDDTIKLLEQKILELELRIFEQKTETVDTYTKLYDEFLVDTFDYEDAIKDLK